jgi:hypothetical protein
MMFRWGKVLGSCGFDVGKLDVLVFDPFVAAKAGIQLHGVTGFRSSPDDGLSKFLELYKRFERLRRASHFSLLAQRKVTKREGTPLGACRASPGKSVSRGRAFRPDSCPGEKESTSVSTPACAACRPRLTAAQGYEGQERGARAKQIKSRKPPTAAFALALLWPLPGFRAQEARCSSGVPSAAAGGWRKSPKGT